MLKVYITHYFIVEDVVDFIEYADKDGDGLISYREYMDILSKNNDKEEEAQTDKGDGSSSSASEEDESNTQKCEPFGEGT
jgi:hypothetical protein